jgi:hypothetical protein
MLSTSASMIFLFAVSTKPFKKIKLIASYYGYCITDNITNKTSVLFKLVIFEFEQFFNGPLNFA